MRIMLWLRDNLTSLILSLLLALVVWISAVTSADPNVEVELTIPLEVLQQPSDIAIVDDLPATVSITVRAPESIIQQLEEHNPLVATINMKDISAGTYRFPVKVENLDQVKPIRISNQNPEKLELRISNLISKTLSLSILIEGEPAIGYQASGLSWEVTTVTITGVENKVQDVTSIVGTMDISDATGSMAKDVVLDPRDINGDSVTGVTLSPNSVLVNQTITLQGGYRNLAVNVITQGSVEPGYRFTSINPAPPTVMVKKQSGLSISGTPIDHFQLSSFLI